MKEIMPTLVRGKPYRQCLQLQKELEELALHHDRIEIFLDALTTPRQVEHYLVSVLRPVIAKDNETVFVIKTDDEQLNIKYAPTIRSIFKRNFIRYDERTDYIIRGYPNKNKISKEIISRKNRGGEDS